MSAPATGDDVTAVLIGSGSAGLTVAIGLAGLDHRVVVVEEGPVGGDCTNVGCIPSKTLLHLARTGAPSPWGEVRKRRDGLEATESTMLADHDRIELLRGSARIVGPGTVEVADQDGTLQRVAAPHIVIATGSRPRTVAIEGMDPARVLTNETLFEIDATPGHLVIVGGGAIAVEMATAVRHLGGAVTIVEVAPRLLGRDDPEVSAIVAQALGEAGVDVRLGTTATSFDEAKATLTLDDGDEIRAVDRVLMAIGRSPRVDGLGLDRLGVDVGPGGVGVDSWGRTSVAGVWAVGDVTGVTATTHGANAMARRVVRAIGLPRLLRVGRPPSIPAAVFGEPEVASVGFAPEKVARRWPEASRVHLRADLADTDRGLTDGVTRGAVIVDVERMTGRILRASIVGPGAAQAIGIFTLAIDRRISMHRLYRMVHPYPTFASAIGVVADEFTRLTLTDLPAQATTWARHLPHRLLRAGRATPRGRAGEE